MNEHYPLTSDAEPQAEPPVADDYRIRIVGDALVLPSGCTMPLKCIKTNQPVEERDMILTNLTWCPNSVGLWALLGSPSLVFAYFVGRELCSITYGLDRRIRYRNIFFTMAKLLACAIFLAATILMAVSVSTHWITEALIFVFFALFLLSVVMLFIGNSPLHVVDYRDGTFWIKGFSNDYLDDLEL